MAQARKPEYQRRGVKPGRFRDWPTDAEAPEVVAARAEYAGSALHKTYPSPAGPPAYRADKAKCGVFREQVWPQLRDALRRAIRERSVGEFRGRFPGRAWVFVHGVLHEARLQNEEKGEYHGFPIQDPRQYPLPKERLASVPNVDIPFRWW